MTSFADQICLDWDAEAMLDALPERVNRYRVSDLAITYCNAAWASQYGVEPSEAIGRPLDSFLSDDELEGLHSQLALLGPDNPALVDTVARAAPNAPGQWLEWSDRWVIGPDGPEVLSVGRDVTERFVAELRLAESEARFRDLADKSSDIVWRLVAVPRPRFDYISPSVENILGYPPSFFLEDFDRILDILDDDGRTAVAQAGRREHSLDRFDFNVRHADGSIVVCETRSTFVRDGMQGVSRDVTELRRLQESLADLALRDPLTGLANRRLLQELLDSELWRVQHAGTPLAVAYIDVDGLKQVNDNHGHDAGDTVLRETARRLLDLTRSHDVVARLGGDEFVLVFEPDEQGLGPFVDRIHAALAAPIELSPTTSVVCSASVGAVDTGTVGYSASFLLTAADEAMYRVKRERRAARR
jgi:diguanylate cyclase (GGDEF)-like protein/PAS domain S-box-containing protein